MTPALTVSAWTKPPIASASARTFCLPKGGMLRRPSELRQVIYVPPELERVAHSMPASVFANYDPHHITGCVLSSLLSSPRSGLPPTVGLADLQTCLAHFDAITELGFQAAALHCDGFAPNVEIVQAFRQRFGHDRGVPSEARPTA